jgi:hypothetical protein
MKNIIFTRQNFNLVYSLLVKTLKQQKAIDIKNDFSELVEKSFVNNFNLNSTLLVNHKNDDDLLLEFDKMVLADCLRKISNIIDQQRNEIHKQIKLEKELDQVHQPRLVDPRKQELERIKQQSAGINHSLAIRPDGYSVMMPSMTNKNDFDSNKNYEHLIKEREQQQKPLNDFYGKTEQPLQSDIQGYSYNGSQSSVKFESNTKEYNVDKDDQAISRDDFENMLRNETLSRDPVHEEKPQKNNSKNDTHLDMSDINDILMLEQVEKKTIAKLQPNDLFITIDDSSFQLELDYDISHVELVDLDIIRNSNNITNYNNKFYFKENDETEHCIVIDPGFYTIDELIGLLNSKMEVKGNCKYDIIKDPNTQKLSINCKGIPPVKSKLIKSGSFHFFKIMFDKPDTMYHILGFNKQVYSNELSYKAPRKYKLYVDSTVCLYIPSIQDSIISKLSLNEGLSNHIINRNFSINGVLNVLDFEIKNDRNEFYDLDGEPLKMYLKITPKV